MRPCSSDCGSPDVFVPTGGKLVTECIMRSITISGGSICNSFVHHSSNSSSNDASSGLQSSDAFFMLGSLLLLLFLILQSAYYWYELHKRVVSIFSAFLCHFQKSDPTGVAVICCNVQETRPARAARVQFWQEQE